MKSVNERWEYTMSTDGVGEVLMESINERCKWMVSTDDVDRRTSRELSEDENEV